MKHILSTYFLAFVVFGASAQNFSPFQPNDTSYYQYRLITNILYYLDQKTAVTSVYFDSTSVIPNAEEFFNYRQTDTLGTGCIDPVRLSFIGSKMIRTSTNDFVFLNNDGDSVFFPSGILLNGSWELYRYPNMNYLEATFDSITELSFLGITDSVKHLTLLTKSPAGTTVAGFYNGKTLQLSKNHGLISTYGFRNFPMDTTLYQLAGYSSLTAGYKHLHAYKIFDFNIGDEFHYHNFWQVSIPSQDVYYIVMQVLSKNSSVNGDTLIYEFARNYYHRNDSWGNTTITLINDTILQSIVFNHYNFLSALPLSFNLVYPGWPGSHGYQLPFYDTTYFSRNRVFSEDFYHFQSPPDLYCYPVGLGIFPQRIYAEGLGEIYETDNTLVGRFDSLVYYKKGSEEWGNPLNWPVILSLEEDQYNLDEIIISPNPFVDQLMISVDNIGFPTDVKIYDISGRLLITQALQDGHNTINTHLFTEGIYVLFIKTPQKVICEKFIKCSGLK